MRTRGETVGGEVIQGYGETEVGEVTKQERTSYLYLAIENALVLYDIHRKYLLSEEKQEKQGEKIRN